MNHCFLSKDLWGDSGTIPTGRSGVAGFAWVGTVCGQYRYSVNEESGFTAVFVSIKFFSIKKIKIIHFSLFF